MYSFESRVRYSELNHQLGTLSCSSIINLFQDCSTFQSEDLNLGLSYLTSKSRVWLLNSWQLNIYHPSPLGESLTIGTWPYDFKGFYGYRNFILKNAEDQVLAAANSIWVYLDAETKRPVKVSNNSGYELEPPFPMKYADRKVDIPKSYMIQPSFSVKKSNIDSYNHVNNGQYIKMAEEYLPEGFKVDQMRVEYRNQAVMGNLILPLVSEENEFIRIALADEEHIPYALI